MTDGGWASPCDSWSVRKSDGWRTQNVTRLLSSPDLHTVSSRHRLDASGKVLPGIDLVELCSPSYMEFASLADGKTTKKTLDDNGMKCTSAHFTLPALFVPICRSRFKWAQDVGMTQMGTAEP